MAKQQDVDMKSLGSDIIAARENNRQYLGLLEQ